MRILCFLFAMYKIMKNKKYILFVDYNIQLERSYMLRLMKKIARYMALFIAMLVCSAIVIKVFTLIGLQYKNSSDVVFIAAISATLAVSVYDVWSKRNNSKNM